MKDLLSCSPGQIIWLNAFIKTLLRAALLDSMCEGYWKALCILCRQIVPSGLPRAQDTSGPTQSGVGAVGEKLEKEQHSPVAPDWDSNSSSERETNIQLCSTPALRVNLREAARESARCLFFSSVCK